MMKMTKIKSCIAGMISIFLLTCGCGKPAALYDSGQVQEGDSGTETREGESREEIPDAQEVMEICVYVCGEVAAPGIYQMAADARIGDALEAAGGMTENAADTWLNLAEHMKDGQKIEVPDRERAEVLAKEAQQEESSLVNLNTATAEQLMSLTGVGQSKAEDILNYREQHGSFQTIEELMQIPGIKERVFEKIKDRITV